jgi:hypothetical protein
VPAASASRKCGGFPDELIKVFKYFGLIVDQKFRKTHHVNEQHIRDFEMTFLLASPDIL